MPSLKALLCERGIQSRKTGLLIYNVHSHLLTSLQRTRHHGIPFEKRRCFRAVDVLSSRSCQISTAGYARGASIRRAVSRCSKTDRVHDLAMGCSSTAMTLAGYPHAKYIGLTHLLSIVYEKHPMPQSTSFGLVVANLLRSNESIRSFRLPAATLPDDG
jgi:hypothetical protein